MDVGLKAISSERGLPKLKKPGIAELLRLNAEHAIFKVLSPGLPVKTGDQLELWAHYADATTNLYRRMYGIRDGRIERTFEIGV
jgi:D-serine deaminase-like pyridoxal phosphate-dependent protein